MNLSSIDTFTIKKKAIPFNAFLAVQRRQVYDFKKRGGMFLWTTMVYVI